MVSKMFMRDWRKMTAEGVEFTPEDIIRLNALAVKVRQSQSAPASTHLPRLCFMPRDSYWRRPLVLREPTIAHDIWIEFAERLMDVRAPRMFDFLHAYALTRPAERLPDPCRPERLRREVLEFAGRRLSRFTAEQLSAAVDYVVFGADWTTGEVAPPKDADGASPSDSSPTIGLLVSGVARRLPVSLDAARRMTASQLGEAVFHSLRADNAIDFDRARDDAMGEYVRTREEIRARSVVAKPSEKRAGGVHVGSAEHPVEADNKGDDHE